MIGFSEGNAIMLAGAIIVNGGHKIIWLPGGGGPLIGTCRAAR
jgi:hypothetical protein